MWCERRMTTVPVPYVAAIAAAASSARSVSHGPGQPLAVPRLRRRARVDDRRLARLRHRALLDLGEIGREQREAVRRVAEEIAGRRARRRRRARCRRARRRDRASAVANATQRVGGEAGAAMVGIHRRRGAKSESTRRLTRPRDSPTILPDAPSRARAWRVGRLRRPRPSQPRIPPRAPLVADRQRRHVPARCGAARALPAQARARDRRRARGWRACAASPSR